MFVIILAIGKVYRYGVYWLWTATFLTIDLSLDRFTYMELVGYGWPLFLTMDLNLLTFKSMEFAGHGRPLF